MTGRARTIGWAAALVAVAAGAFVTTVAVGQSRGPRGGDEGERGAPSPGEHLRRFLGLSEEQVEQVREADPTFHQNMRTLHRNVKIEQLKLANLVESDEASEKKLKAQFDALGDAQRAVHDRVAEHVLAIRPHLTSEQRNQFLRLLARHLRGGAGGPEGKGPGPEGPPPGGPGAGGPHPGGPPPHGPREGHRPPPPPGPPGAHPPRGGAPSHDGRGPLSFGGAEAPDAIGE